MAHQGGSRSIMRSCLFVHFRNFPAVSVHVLLKSQDYLKGRGLVSLFSFPSLFPSSLYLPYKSLSQFPQFLPAAHIIEYRSLATIIISH